MREINAADLFCGAGGSLFSRKGSEKIRSGSIATGTNDHVLTPSPGEIRGFFVSKTGWHLFNTQEHNYERETHHPN